MKAVLKVVVLAAALFATAATAQEPPSVVAYYQQYAAALERGDVIAAENAAALALAASEQRDGDGGRTPILALNLARVRIQLGRWQDASAPAQRAYDLSRANPASGVDQSMSGLLLGRVRLANEGFRASGFVAQMLDRAKGRDDLLGDRYDAAEQLGAWAMQTRNFLIARRAWSDAAEAAAGAPFAVEFARGRALAFEGVSITMQSTTRDVTMSSIDARQALERLSEAHALIRPFAFAELPTTSAAAAARDLYAQILAWDAAIWSKMASDDPARRGRNRLDANPQRIDGIPVCAIQRQSGDTPHYPSQQGREGQLGAVVIGLRFDDQGLYQGADVMATVGDEEFGRSLAATASTWIYTTAVSEGCRPARLLFVPIAFALSL